MELSGAQVIVECILEQGVDCVFGIPGGMVLPLFDAVYQRKDRLRHVLTAHEQAAAHAADGYARASGGVGVCVATSGPGATNLVTGIATSYMDSSPVVFITGNIDSAYIGSDSFQEVDITGVTIPITKHSVLVHRVGALADTMRMAFAVARQGRPGPVLVDVPKDVQMALTEFEPSCPAPQEPGRLSRTQMETALRLIDGAKAPLLLCGGGVIRANACEAFAALAEKLDAPVVSTLMGLGGFPASDKRFLGMAGMHGLPAANSAVRACDLLIGVGTRFSERLLSAGGGELPAVLHLDADRAEIGKNTPAAGYVVGDAKQVLEALCKELPRRKRGAWRAFLNSLPPPAAPAYPERLCSQLRRLAGENAIVVTDVGQHQMWAAQTMAAEHPRTFVTSGGTGTMGFGLGAAMGAQMARPDRAVLLITGDGSFRMSSHELDTMARERLPIVIVILNNHAHGMVRQWQTLFYEKRYAGSSLPGGPDWAALARAYGLPGAEAQSLEDVARAVGEALEARMPLVLNCEIDPDALVRPMTDPGGTGYVL